MKTRIKNYLSITKKEWNGLVIFVALIAIVIAAPYAYRLIHKDTTINFNTQFFEILAKVIKSDRKFNVHYVRRLLDITYEDAVGLYGALMNG